ncbi:baeRF2 domain-containing protein [Streptomyces sp. TE5632]
MLVGDPRERPAVHEKLPEAVREVTVETEHGGSTHVIAWTRHSTASTPDGWAPVGRRTRSKVSRPWSRPPGSTASTPC